MAMKELLRVTLDELQIREACEEAVRARLSTDLRDEDVRAIIKSTAGVTIDVVIRKRHAPRKPRVNGVASAGKLSEAEQRFG